MTHQTEALAEDKIINLTQEVGECGATRVHQLGGDTLTIFKDNELFEFARKCAALSSQPPAAGVLAMRVMQSDLYGQLDDTERAQCDEQIRRHLDWLKGDASLTATAGSAP